jgi:hypothetical protein
MSLLSEQTFSFTGLPASLASDLLERAGELAPSIKQPLDTISQLRGLFRDRLGGLGLLGLIELSAQDGCASVSAIRPCEQVLTFPTGAVSAVAAIAAEGITAAGRAPLWDGPRHRVLFIPEKQGNGISPVRNALAHQLGLELAAEVSHDLVIFDGFSAAPFIAIMDALRPAMEDKNSAVARAVLQRLKPSLALLKSFSEGTSSARVTGFPAEGASVVRTALPEWPEGCDDPSLVTAVLEPGEYAGPFDASVPGLDRAASFSIRDEGFMVVRDAIAARFAKRQLVFFRPWSWTPSFALDIDGEASAATPHLLRILNGIAHQCATPGSRLPYAVGQVRILTARLKNALVPFRQALVNRMMSDMKDDPDGLFALLMVHQ